jgi:hypothetical protein
MSNKVGFFTFFYQVFHVKFHCVNELYLLPWKGVNDAQLNASGKKWVILLEESVPRKF